MLLIIGFVPRFYGALVFEKDFEISELRKWEILKAAHFDEEGGETA